MRSCPFVASSPTFRCFRSLLIWLAFRKPTSMTIHTPEAMKQRIRDGNNHCDDCQTSAEVYEKGVKTALRYYTPVGQYPCYRCKEKAQRYLRRGKKLTTIDQCVCCNVDLRKKHGGHEINDGLRRCKPCRTKYKNDLNGWKLGNKNMGRNGGVIFEIPRTARPMQNGAHSSEEAEDE